MLNLGDSKEAQAYAGKNLAITEELATSDRTNVQARYDLVDAYDAMGDSFRSTRPATAAAWYRKSISLTQVMADRREARNYLAQLDEFLAAVLVRKDQAPERLRLLQESVAIRQELIKTSLNGPMYRMFLMRLRPGRCGTRSR